jgi:hypothetical protein
MMPGASLALMSFADLPDRALIGDLGHWLRGPFLGNAGCGISS